MYVVTLPASANPVSFAKQAKESGADILEIRGDITPLVEPFTSPLPLLVSPRGKGQLWSESLNPSYIDLELQK